LGVVFSLGAPSWVKRSGPDHLVQPQSVICAKPTSTPFSSGSTVNVLQHTVNEELPERQPPTMRLFLTCGIFVLLAFASPGLAAPLNSTTQVKVRAVFRLLVGLNGEGRSSVASLSRETTRITQNNIAGRGEDKVYMEVDRESIRVIVEIEPGAAPRATGRFWVDDEGPYRIQEGEWTEAFNNGELDITDIMSSDLRSDLLNLGAQYQRSGGQVGIGRRVPSGGVG